MPVVIFTQRFEDLTAQGQFHAPKLIPYWTKQLQPVRNYANYTCFPHESPKIHAVFWRWDSQFRHTCSLSPYPPAVDKVFFVFVFVFRRKFWISLDPNVYPKYQVSNIPLPPPKKNLEGKKKNRQGLVRGSKNTRAKLLGLVLKIGVNNWMLNKFGAICLNQPVPNIQCYVPCVSLTCFNVLGRAIGYAASSRLWTFMYYEVLSIRITRDWPQGKTRAQRFDWNPDGPQRFDWNRGGTRKCVSGWSGVRPPVVFSSRASHHKI